MKQKKVDQTIQALTELKIQVRMFPSIDDPRKLFLILDLEQEMVEQYAEELDYEIKMMEANLKFSFIGDQKEKFEMFRSKDIQGIIYKKLTNAISL